MHVYVLCMHMHVCEHICLCVYTYIHTCMHIYLCIYVCMCALIYACVYHLHTMHVSMHVCTCIQICKCTYVWIDLYMACVYRNAHIHACVCMYMSVYMHMCISVQRVHQTLVTVDLVYLIQAFILSYLHSCTHYYPV